MTPVTETILLCREMARNSEPYGAAAGATMSTFTVVDDKQGQDVCPGPADSVFRIGRHTLGKDAARDLLQPLFQAAKGRCQGTQDFQMLAGLLTRYRQ